MGPESTGRQPGQSGRCSGAVAPSPDERCKIVVGLAVQPARVVCEYTLFELSCRNSGVTICRPLEGTTVSVGGVAHCASHKA